MKNKNKNFNENNVSCFSPPPPPPPSSANASPGGPLLLPLPHADGRTPDPGATLLPDCNADEERSAVCNFSYTWEPPAWATAITSPTAATNRSHDPAHPLNPAAMLVPLHADWDGATAAWGPAWDAHVYGAGALFAGVALASALNLLCLPLRCPSGCGYFALVSLSLLGAGGARAFWLLYDAYGHRGRLPSPEAALALRESAFPCLTAAFGLVFLLLSMRSRMQQSYSAFRRPFSLACLVALHFAAALGPAAMLGAYRHSPAAAGLWPCLVSRGAYVALAAFLSVAYFVFYAYVRADSKHIYRLNNTSPTPAERYNRCPYAESRDWERAAALVCVSALFSLACAALQLYAMLRATGAAGGGGEEEEEAFGPWPWWTFQSGCRACELGVCLTLALAVAQPVYCGGRLPGAGSCWTELLAAKSPILPYHWTLSQQEKLAIVDTGLGETESLPLYTLVDERLLGGSLNGLDLLYHSNRALAYRDSDLSASEKPGFGADGCLDGGAASGRSSLTSDSTADLRPPSPIDLRRSIDEALFGESLFPMGLFGPARPLLGHASDPSAPRSFFPLSAADAGLFGGSEAPSSEPPPPSSRRSCGVTAASATTPPSPSRPLSAASSSSATTGSSPERWRGSSSSCASYRPSFGGSSLVLCPSPGPGPGAGDPQRRYRTLGSASQESLTSDPPASEAAARSSLQEEFISVCRQMDASSVCSETIDL
ncbi:hypothetical protein NHX12_020796 [Muraenolepis orangiensis]|uniref:Proline-rich transmembrane protein 3/4 domain-containing protein n=1 Tax=Muraenolepis orangiensis TaxID=630683 RepID=A0A9Q0IWY5_9TELE|nr:hypothetical protein NHX12_020796 [Muraenolepis orangiensis]